MALSTDFYSQIYDRENKLINLNNQGFLNIYYLKYDNLVNFYTEKKEILTKEFQLTSNQMLQNFIQIIDKIINKINEVIVSFEENGYANVNEVIDLFLVNQMNNKVSNTNKITTQIPEPRKEEKNNKLRMEVLKSIKNGIIASKKSELDDDDFFETQKER